MAGRASPGQRPGRRGCGGGGRARQTGTVQKRVYTGHLDPGAADYVYLPVDVPAGTTRLAVRYSYDRPPLAAGTVGNACDVVLVRAFYRWPVFTPILGFFLQNIAGGYHLISTAAAFRNEPYNTSTNGCT